MNHFFWIEEKVFQFSFRLIKKIKPPSRLIGRFLEFHFLFENIKKEKKFEIKLATTQERIQKNIKLVLSVQLMPANIKVIKNVVVKFFKSTIEFFFL